MNRLVKHKITWIAAALSILLSSCGIPQAGADSIADIKAQSIQSGIKRISSNVAVYPTYTMLDTITVEYSDEIVLPDSDPKTLYTFTDDEAGGKTREVTAVYMNNQREINKGENQSFGRFVIIQLSRVENPEPDESEPWQPESTASMALHFQSSSYLHTLRTDYSGVKIRQNFDALNARGQTVQSSSENVGWPEFQGFSINNVLQGKDGDVHYSVYIPEDYNHEKRYPMIIVLPGFGTARFNLWYNEFKFMNNFKIRVYQKGLWKLVLLRLIPTGRHGFCKSCLIGYPIWWHSAPMVIGTFLESYDLSNIDIYPFSQSASMDTEQFEQSMDFIRDCAGDAVVHEGLFAGASDTEDITAWLAENGLIK